MRSRLTLAFGASVGVVLGAPYVGQIRGAVQNVVPRQYVTIVAAIVAVSLLAAIGIAVATIRTRRTLRYGAVCAAVAIAASYAYLIRTGNAEVDAVERFHFVEYGLLTWLFYRVWESRPDARALVLPSSAGIVVGILDEAFQWFVPSRVGDLRDVLLDCVAVACGLLFAAALRPPGGVAMAREPRVRAELGAAASVVVCAAALFVYTVHVGHDIRDPEAGTFRSRFDRPQLEGLSADRVLAWRQGPPSEMRLMSREDQYLAEGRWHIQRRNEAIAAKDVIAATGENRILEKFFAPVLDLGVPGSRLSPESDAVGAGATAGFVSDAGPYAIHTWNPWVYWAMVAGLLVVVWLVVSRARSSNVPGRSR